MERNVNVYLITNKEKSFFESDLYFTRKVKELYLENKVEMVFSDSFEKFKLFNTYCLHHNILRKSLNSKDNVDHFLDIFNYIKKNNLINIVDLVEREDVNELEGYFNKNFIKTHII